MSTKGTEAIDQEIAQEKAESLGLAGRRFETALRDLRDYDASAPKDGDAHAATREALVARAADRLLAVIVQRESHGLRDPSYVFKFYSVPKEIVARLGARAD